MCSTLMGRYRERQGVTAINGHLWYLNDNWQLEKKYSHIEKKKCPAHATPTITFIKFDIKKIPT